jgi:hypothetical protein
MTEVHTGQASRQARLRADRRRPAPRSLVWPFARHAAAFLIAAQVAYWLSAAVRPADQPVPWLLSGVIVGALAGLLSRTWLGAVFVTVGASVGLVLDLQRHGAAFDELAASGAIYAGALLVAGLTALLTAAAVELALGRIRASER